MDPKGEILRDTGYLLMKKGCKVRVLDLIDMPRSHCYNPFVYLRDDNDVQRLVTNLFKSTTPKGTQSQDPFWDTAARLGYPEYQTVQEPEGSQERKPQRQHEHAGAGSQYACRSYNHRAD